MIPDLYDQVIDHLAVGHGGRSDRDQLVQPRVSTHNYDFFDTGLKGSEAPDGHWTHGPSLDGKGTYTVFKNVPMGQVPDLGPAGFDSAAETKQIS